MPVNSKNPFQVHNPPLERLMSDRTGCYVMLSRLASKRQTTSDKRIEQAMNEATARIQINDLLQKAGWRFFSDADGPANIRLEQNVTLKPDDLQALGDDFEWSDRGAIDFLLLDERGFPLVVLEAKSESKQPLVGKEQARKYAQSLNCRFVILSNGNLHYFWDLERGNPYQITAFPTPGSVGTYHKAVPDPQRLIAEPVGNDYIVLTQRPNYASEAAWLNEAERPY